MSNKFEGVQESAKEWSLGCVKRAPWQEEARTRESRNIGTILTNAFQAGFNILVHIICNVCRNKLNCLHYDATYVVVVDDALALAG